MTGRENLAGEPAREAGRTASERGVDTTRREGAPAGLVQEGRSEARSGTHVGL